MALTAGTTDHRETFLASHATARRIVRLLARRHGLSAQDMEDAESLVMLRLIDDDYAVFRKFRGDSSLATYLTVVITMLVNEWRVSRWGRWRASAAARRLGPVAVHVEALVHRDGFKVAEAVTLLNTTGVAAVTDGEVRRLLARLPARQPLRPVEVGAEPLATVPARGSADTAALEARAEQRRAEVAAAVAAALARLEPQERVLVRMRFWEGMMVSQIARALATQQKPLYRRLEAALGRLRADLEANGLTREQVAELFDGAAS